MKRSGRRSNVACPWPQLHPLDDPALRWTDHNNLMCHWSTPSRLISNTDNLEDDWQAVRADERAARPAQLLLSQTGTEVTVREECLGRGVHASWSCLCLPSGRVRLKSDSCKWVQLGARSRSVSHPAGLMGSVRHRTLRNPCVPGANYKWSNWYIKPSTSLTLNPVSRWFDIFTSPAVWQVTPWQLLHLNSLLAKLYCVQFLPHCLISLIFNTDVKAWSICCSKLKKKYIQVNEGSSSL